MPSSSYSGTDIKKLLSNGWWALRLIWSTNASLSLGLTAATFARGIVPAGLALFGRGLIDAVVSNRYSGSEGMNAILPWVFLGFGLTVLEAMGSTRRKILYPPIEGRCKSQNHIGYSRSFREARRCFLRKPRQSRYHQSRPAKP